MGRAGGAVTLRGVTLATGVATDGASVPSCLRLPEMKFHRGGTQTLEMRVGLTSPAY